MSDLHEAAEAVTQGGEAVTRLAHNEENAGSNPAPATTEPDEAKHDGLDIRISHEPGSVVVAFDQLIKWVRMGPDQAEEFANHVIANAIMARRGKTKLSSASGIVLPLKRGRQQ